MKNLLIRFNKFYSILFFIFVAGSAFGQKNVLQGIITDNQSNFPLEGATVLLLPEKTSTVTNQAGKFHFPQINKETISVVISAIGYATKTIPLEEFKKANYHIELVPKNIDSLP